MDQLIVNRMPHNVEAEQSVLGAVLIESSRLPELIEILKPSDFYVEQNRDIYAVILTMYGKGRVVDGITVMDELRLQETKDIDTLRTYILRLMEITPTAAHVLEYAQIVKDHAVLRAVATAAADISAMVGEAAGEAQAILDAAEQKIYAIRNENANTHMSTLSEVFHEVYLRLDELAQRPGELPGIRSGFNELDARLGGLIPSNLIIFAANAGVGKTSAALNIMLSAAKLSQKSVAFFCLEMSNEQLGLRLLSSAARVDNKKLRDANLTHDEWDRLANASAKLAELDIYFDDNPSSTVLEMKAKCRRIPNLGLVIIDYLQLIQSGGKRNDNRVQEVGEISRSLKIMAKELHVPVICCAQLSRRNTQREDKRPILSDLRESGSIEQDADVVVFLHREAYHDRETENQDDAELIIAKNRHGETGSIEMKWDGKHTSFVAIDYGHG
ncbi:MAG: replicative DNA helicase [Oscillospiraceae bacterium]|nr:replicative DNA helicase [Oscillospiraceae bacterium]